MYAQRQSGVAFGPGCAHRVGGLQTPYWLRAGSFWGLSCWLLTRLERPVSYPLHVCGNDEEGWRATQRRKVLGEWRFHDWATTPVCRYLGTLLFSRSFLFLYKHDAFFFYGSFVAQFWSCGRLKTRVVSLCLSAFFAPTNQPLPLYIRTREGIREKKKSKVHVPAISASGPKVRLA